jgi:hypothetical protein
LSNTFIVIYQTKELLIAMASQNINDQTQVTTLWNFVISRGPRVSIQDMENWLLLNDYKNEDLADEVEDLIDEAYFNSDTVSGELAVNLLKFGMKHLGFQPNWDLIVAKRQIHPTLRAYAMEKLHQLTTTQ